MRTEESASLQDYDFDYPPELVAAEPASPRDSARLLVLAREGRVLAHARFQDLGGWLKPGDCLVLNSSRVLPARLVGRKESGGRAELLLLRELGPGLWSALSTDLRPGCGLLLPGGASAQALGRGPEGEWRLRFPDPDVRGLLERHGEAPLPPYILKRRASRSPLAPSPQRLSRRGRRACWSGALQDRERYQTVYAREEGSVAAPTAGLHFTPELLAELAGRGVRVAELTLHVGLGTFRPVSSPDIRDHAMLPEPYRVAEEALEAILRARREGGRIVAVGTSAVRTLETLAERASSGDPLPGAGEGLARLFIRPGHPFRLVDALITNFHLPRSTPLLLAAAFAGRERLLAAYREAIERRYRLFSYGDSMLIL